MVSESSKAKCSHETNWTRVLKNRNKYRYEAGVRMKYPKYYQNHRSNVFAYQPWPVHNFILYFHLIFYLMVFKIFYKLEIPQ